MPIAPNIDALKKRVDSYFWRNKSTEVRLLIDILETYFMAVGRVAVVGGLVRDFAREGRDAFRSDIDLAIDAPVEMTEIIAKRLNAKPNRFGGYGVKVGVWKIDFWALETTWAARNCGISVSQIEDVIKCTFFDWDSIAYDLNQRRIICDSHYLDRMRAKILDINVLDTPSIDGNLLRALRRLAEWNLRPGRTLQIFIDNHLNNVRLEQLQLKEKELSLSAVINRWPDVETAKRALRCGFALDTQIPFDF